MPSSWLAVEAGTDLLARARQIQRSWENLLVDGGLDQELSPQATAGVRPDIVESWRRVRARGLDPTDLLPSIEADPSETRERWLEHPLGSLRHVLVGQLEPLAVESNSVVQVTDASGLTLYLGGPAWLKAKAAEMNLVEGARCSETVNGTNGVGTALAEGHPVQVFAFEHFSHHHREWVCSGAPIHDLVSGRLVGIIDLSSPWRIAHPRSLELVTSAARRTEQCLLEARRDRDARLRRRYGELTTRSTDLLVNREGYLLIGEDSAPPKPLDIPESGGEIAMSDGSLAVAEPLGQGEAYLVRRPGPLRASPARGEALERAEERGRELASKRAAPSRARDPGSAGGVERGLPSPGAGERLSAYLQAAIDCVIVADASGRIVEFNLASERTFGYSRKEALGRTMAELIVPPSLRERHIAAFARFVKTREGSMLGRRVELTGMRADGSEFPVELALSEVEAEPVLICAALRDISARKQAESHLRELAEEQAALRRVATLVAYESSSDRLVAIVAEQVARVFDVPQVRLIRYEPNGSVVIGGFSESDDEPFPIGSRWPLGTPGLATTIRQTGRAARVEDYAQTPGDGAAVVRAAGMRSAVGSPIVVEGGVWGAIVLLSPRRASLPEDTGGRLADFTELVATAIANAESRAALAQLVDEQAALRSVATLVARGAGPNELFSAVSNEVGRLFGADQAAVARFDSDRSEMVVVGATTGIRGVSVGTRWALEDFLASTAVYRTGRPARRDHPGYGDASGPVADSLRQMNLLSTVAAPIVVEGHVWGVMTMSDRYKLLPADAEQRLEKFTELVATAIANTESRAALAASEARARDLAGEQSALRRVATLVANGASSDELFGAVAREVAGVLGIAVVGLQRFDGDGTFTMMGIAGETSFTVGSRWPVTDEGLAGMILATGRPARKDDYTSMPGPLGEAVRDDAMTSTVGVPIVVEGAIWGFMVGAARPGTPIPDDTEKRFARFTELVGTAIANTNARLEVSRMAEEQAALRRVATLVARGVSPEEIFSAVTNEMAQLFVSPQAYVGRFEPDGSAMVVVGVSDGIRGISIGSRWALEDYMASTGVYRTGHPVRFERSDLDHVSGPMADVLREIGAVSYVGAPIAVEGKQWGFVTVTDVNKRLPADAEKRLEKFAELVATAIANAESRAELAASEARARKLAEQQASLRRVATLVARGANPEEIFTAAAQEVADVLSVELVTVCRYETDGMLVLSSVGVPAFPSGSRWPIDLPSLPASVYMTGGPVRIDDFGDAEGLDVIARDGGVRSAVGVPITVDGAVWGSISTASTKAGPFPADAEERLARFTNLIATAVSNAAMRAELAASRARVIAAADESRRRIERDLHDGAQQQLVTLGVALQRAQAKIPSALDEVRADVGRVADGLAGALNELRDLSRGIHPAILTESGLSPALKALGRRSDVRVKLDVGFEHRLPDQVEVAAYYTVSEALTNASKHANAARAWVRLRVEDDLLLLAIRDDGVGGADASRGSGLIGLRDRIEALGGRIRIESPTGAGTLIDAEIPIAGPAERNVQPDGLLAPASAPSSPH